MSVQRYELVDVGTYSEARELVEAPSSFAEHADRRWAHEDYWCRAQEVFDLEATVAALEDEIARLRAALEWYAGWEDRYDHAPNADFADAVERELIEDAGARARRALDGKEADGE